MKQARSNRTLAVLLTLVMLVQAIAVCGFTVSAADASNEPDVVYEESFNSGLWAVEPKTSKVNYDAYHPTAPTVTDGKLSLTEGNSAAFYWKNIPGIKEKGTYTLSFDVDITDEGNNNTLFSGVTWKRELNVLLGGYATGINFRSDNKKILPAGSGITDNNFASATYSVKIVLDTTVSPNTIKTTLVKGDEINVTKSTTVDDTTAAYAECSPFWVFRCEDGAVELSNFTFTDGAISISGFEEIGESFLTTEGEGLWTLEEKTVSTGYSAYNYNPTAPIGYNGRLYMEKGDAVSLWWKKIPGVKEKGILTLSFDVDVTNNGNGKSLITEATWKRELNVAIGGYWSSASFRNDTQKIIASGSGYTDETYASDTYSVTIVWDKTVTPNTVKTTITDDDFSASKTATVATTADWYDECSQFWGFRCEDGAVEISNFKFSAVNYAEPVSTTEINVPEGKEAIVEADLIYNGAESRMMLDGYELISLADGKISMCNGVTQGIYGEGAYHVKTRINPTQKMLLTEVTLPEGGTIRRGIPVSDKDRSLLLEVFGESAACVTGATVRYEDITVDEYTVSTEEPVYEGFGANVYNIVTSFTDARYDRAFAWTARESFIGDADMAVKYRADGEDAWTVVEAVREVETLNEVENYFEADVTGLQANTRYEYKIGKKDSSDEENDWSKSYYFTTAKATVTDFSFVALGDNQGLSWAGSTADDKGYAYTETAITQALSKLENPAFILNTGDMVETNAPDEWNWYFKAMGESVTSIPHFATLGGGKHDNHDYFDMHFNHPNNGGKDAYTNVNNILNATPTGADVVNYLDETVYSFNHGDVHVIVVDSGAVGHANSRILMQEQREWLAADLEENKDAKWKIVLTHQPAYNQRGANYQREFLADIIESYGVDLVLHGHDHFVSRTYPMKNNGQIVTKEVTDVIEKGIGTVYATIGSTTVNHTGIANPNMEYMMTIVEPESLQPTYTVVDVKGDNLTVTIRQADGLVLDTFTIAGEAEPPVEELKLTGAYLNLTNDINVLYSANVPAGYENPYMVFEFDGELYTVTDYTEAEDGELLFAFEGVAPQMVGDNIKATLFATKDGVEESVEKAEYSVLTYCKNMLNKTDDAEMKTLLSDLLVYAAASQTYMDYKTDTLVTEGLSLTPSTFAPLTSTDKAIFGTADARVEWIGAALRYENAMAVKLNFKASEELTLKVTINGRTTVYDAKDWETDQNGNYVVYFRGILATEYGDVVTACFYDGDVQVGQSVTYSVNSYVYSMQNTADENLAALVQATYNYGASAEIYVNK